MKKFICLLVTLAVIGIQTPVCAMPSVQEVQETIQGQQEDTQDPRVQNSHKAIILGYSAFATAMQLNELNDTEKQIAKIFEDENLGPSIMTTFIGAIDERFLTDETATEEQLQQALAEKMQDPAFPKKLVAAYAKNPYIQQLVPLFVANQNRYTLKELDQNALVESVASILQLQLAMLQGMTQEQ